MQIKPLAAVAVLAFLAGCSSSGGGSGLRAAGGGLGGGDAPPAVDTAPSIESVPEDLRAQVKADKTYVPGVFAGTTLTTWKVDGEDALAAGGYDVSALPLGFASETKAIETGITDDATGDVYLTKGNLRLYNQSYSAVYGVDVTEFTAAGTSVDPATLAMAGQYDSGALGYFGLATTLDEINALVADKVTATYKGVAWTKTHDGVFTYNVNFGDQKGSGTITGLGDAVGDITLLSGDLFSGFAAIGGDASMSGSLKDVPIAYFFRFFGPGAEEIAGNVFRNDNSNAPGTDFSIPVAGKR